MNNKIRGLLLDLGNTIVYNKEFDFEKGLRKLYDISINPKLSYDEFLKINQDLKKVTYDLRLDYEINFQNYLNFLITYCDLMFTKSIKDLEIEFVKVVERLELVPGIIEVLSFCQKNNIEVVVLSNSTFSSNALSEQIKEFNIIPYFKQILSSSDNVFRKPHTLFFNLGVKALNFSKDNILYVGNDYQIDIIGAHHAGLKTCWYNRDGLENPNNIPCLDITNHSQLLQILKYNLLK